MLLDEKGCPACGNCKLFSSLGPAALGSPSLSLRGYSGPASQLNKKILLAAPHPKKCFPNAASLNGAARQSSVLLRPEPVGLSASPFTLSQPADPPVMHNPERKDLEESNLFQSSIYPQCVQKSYFGCKVEDGKGKGGKLPDMKISNLSKGPGHLDQCLLVWREKTPWLERDEL